MARRSPLNPRYQKDTGPAGKTRRSASAAKPKRDAGGHAPVTKKKAARPTFRDAMRSEPTTPEMKKWRRIWWILIVAALAAITVLYLVPSLRANLFAQIAAIVIYAVGFGGSLYIEFRIIRRLRDEAKAAAKAVDKKK